MIRRSVRAGLAVSFALVLACGDTPTPTFAGVNGTHDLALIGDLLFVTSTDDNDLRVVDLVAPERAWFVRAPNPLFPLSIPVVDRPIALARDTQWVEGVDRGGNWIFALSANGQEISVVSAAREELVERGRITAGGTEQITSIAGFSAGADQPSILYVATYDGVEARIREVTINPPATVLDSPGNGCAADGRLCLGLTAAPLVTERAASVQSLLVLPSSGAERRIAYSLRRTSRVVEECQSSGKPAECVQTFNRETSFMLGVSGATPAKTLLEFGRPIRHLFTHPRYADQPEAQHVFGIIDEDACLPSANCRGVIAVVGPPGVGRHAAAGGATCGGAVGKYACDFTGQPMLPIEIAGGLIMSAAASPEASIGLDEQAAQPPTRLMGVIGTADGRLVFWDAENLKHFDTNLENATSADLGLQDPVGTVLAYVPGIVPNSIQLANGAARDETLTVTYLGVLPGMEALQVAASGTELQVLGRDPVPVVEVGDVAHVIERSGCPAGSADITEVRPNAQGGGTLVLAAPLPAGCTVQLRPAEGATKRWVVAGTESGYFGRIAPQAADACPDPATNCQRLSLPEDPARWDSFFVQRTEAARAPLSFAFLDPGPEVPRGQRYFAVTRGQFQRATVSIDESRRRFSANVASQVLFRPGTDRLLVAYSSGDVVLQIATRTVVAGTAVSTFDDFR